MSQKPMTKGVEDGMGDGSESNRCGRCGQPLNNGWKHNYESGYGDFATISCSAPVDSATEVRGKASPDEVEQLRKRMRQAVALLEKDSTYFRSHREAIALLKADHIEGKG